MTRSHSCWALAAALVLAACSTVPQQDSQVEHARSSVAAVESDPQVAQYAPLELRQTEDAWQRAEAAWRNGDGIVKVHHLAYLADQQAAVTHESAHLRATQAAIAAADAERERVRLDARTREAQLARVQAEAAQAAADERSAQAERARADAAEAARRADLYRQRAASAQQQADVAQQQVVAANARLLELQQQVGDLATAVRGLQARPTEHGTLVTLGDVLFDVDRATLNPGGERVVRQLAAVLDRQPDRHITIAGFTDSTGSDAYNQTLSESRADAVRDVLMSAGVAPGRITTRGYGKAYPVATNASTAGRQLNRRVEVMIGDDVNAIVANDRPVPAYVPPATHVPPYVAEPTGPAPVQPTGVTTTGIGR